MPINTVTKHLALRFLPDRALQLVKKLHYSQALRRMSEEEEPDLRVLKILVEPNQTVVDIGANIGVYAKYLSEYVGPSGTVISVEPIPLTFDILRYNIKKLALKNVKATNCAISDAEGSVKMQVPRYDSGGENFYEAAVERGLPDDLARSFVVRATTIDTLSAHLPSVHFIKCDVEGHELQCVRGAAATITRCKPAWLIEISGRMEDECSSASKTLRILSEGGYRAYWFDGASLRPHATRAKCVNYFFLTSSQTESLRQKGLRIDGEA